MTKFAYAEYKGQRLLRRESLVTSHEEIPVGFLCYVRTTPCSQPMFSVHRLSLISMQVFMRQWACHMSLLGRYIGKKAAWLPFFQRSFSIAPGLFKFDYQNCLKQDFSESLPKEPQVYTDVTFQNAESLSLEGLKNRCKDVMVRRSFTLPTDKTVILLLHLGIYSRWDTYAQHFFLYFFHCQMGFTALLSFTFLWACLKSLWDFQVEKIQPLPNWPFWQSYMPNWS